MTINKITIYEIEERGIILNESCHCSSSDHYIPESEEEFILKVIQKANEQPIEEPVQYFSIGDYYPIAETCSE